jgi:hypothetical protein
MDILQTFGGRSNSIPNTSRSMRTTRLMKLTYMLVIAG